MEPVADKRQSKRVPFNQSVEIFPVFPSYSDYMDEGGKGSLESFSQDLSSGGIGLKIMNPLKAGSLLKLRFESAEKKKIEIFGKIAWSTGNLCGVSFFVPPDIIQTIQNFITGLFLK